MKNSHLRYGKRLVQAWIPEDLLEKSCAISGKGLTDTITEALDMYSKSGKSVLEVAQERYEASVIESARLKTLLEDLNKKYLQNAKKEVEKDIESKNNPGIKQMTEKERNEIWEVKIKPILKRKISEVGFEQVIRDERMLDNFSKGLCISTGELKEKISTEWGVV